MAYPAEGFIPARCDKIQKALFAGLNASWRIWNIGCDGTPTLLCRGGQATAIVSIQYLVSLHLPVEKEWWSLVETIDMVRSKNV